MTTYNTRNPIGSKDPRDLYDNAENLDTAVNDTSRDTWNDRLGRSRKTMSGMEREFNADQTSRDNRFNTFIASSGYQFLGDYAVGIEITEYNQIIRDSDGEFWRLSGEVELPYTTTGAGLPEDDSLTPLGDAVLRQELANPALGAAMVGRGVVAVGSIADLLALPDGQRKEGLQYLVKGYHAGSDIGSENYYWDPARDKSDHTGGNIIDPSKTFPADWSNADDVAAWFTADGVGTGCYVSVEDRTGANLVERFGALESIVDNSAAIQATADACTIVCGLPKRVYRHSSTINLTLFCASLFSEASGNEYNGVTFEYNGSGDQFNCAASVNYMKVNGVHLRGVPAVSTDYYNTGSVAINTEAGATSVQVIDSWVEGFQYLFKGSYKSFYNKFHRNRLERFEVGLFRYSNNNLEFVGNRVMRFHQAIMHNGPNGPLTVNNNSFEIFNGQILVATGVERGVVSFFNNYVEIYDSYDLPTNFPQSQSPGAIPGKFGGNILFTGPYGSLSIYDNEMQIGGVFRVSSSSSFMDHFYAEGNNYHDYETGSNLDRLYSMPPCNSVHINDRKGTSIGATGPYSRTYNQPHITVTNPNSYYFHYDAISEKVIHTPSKLHALTLQNGWANSDSRSGNVRALFRDGSVMLSGLLDGSEKTGDTVFIIPENFRPYEYGKERFYANVSAASAFGSGSIVRFRYFYSSGEFRVEGSPESLRNITLDGLIIPPRY